MKKKLLLSVLAIACVIACVFGLAACSKEVTRVTMSTNTLGMKVGDTARLTATIEPADASDKTLIWESSEPSVATVNDNGVVTAMKEGYALIHAYAKDRKHWDVCNVYVSKHQSEPQAEVEGLSIQTGFSHTSTTDFPINVMLSVGDEDTLSGQIFFTRTGEVPIAWTSEPAGIVEVEAIGSYEPNYSNPTIQASIKALQAGDATVTVSAGGKSASCTVRVTTEPSIKYLDFTCYNGEEEQYFLVNGFVEHAMQTPTEIVIPSEMYGLPVKGIRDHAFENTDITSVTISQGITSIEAYAFQNCTELANVLLPEGLTSIGSFVFQNCSKIKNITIPDGILGDASRGYGIFDGCPIERITCPADWLSQISKSAMREITVTSGEELYLYYDECSNLEKLTFGANIKTFNGQLLFAGTLDYTGTLADWCATEGIGSLCSENGISEQSSIAWIETAFVDGVLTIPSGVETIPERAFAFLNGVTSINLPESVTSIGNAIVGVDGLINLNINYSGDIKGWCELEGIENLLSGYVDSQAQINVGGNPLSGEITIPEGTTRIGARAFALEAITAVSIPSTVIEISEEAFYHSGITELNIPDGVEKVGRLYSLRIQTLRLPATLTETVVVEMCEYLASIQFADGFDYDKIELSNCPYKGDEYGGGYYLGNKLNGIKYNVDWLIIPQSCSAISDGVFQTQEAQGLKYLIVESEKSTLFNGVSFNCPNLTVIGRNLPRDMYGVKQHYSSAGVSCTDDGWVYYVDSQYNQSSLVAYIGEGGEITVPSQLGGKALAWCMVHSEFQPFLHRNDITKITFTSRTITIDTDALFSLPNLTEIILAETVGEFIINIPRFTDCEKLEGISLAGGYANYHITMKTAPNTEAVVVTPTDAANTLSYIKNSTYKLFTIVKAVS